MVPEAEGVELGGPSPGCRTAPPVVGTHDGCRAEGWLPQLNSNSRASSSRKLPNASCIAVGSPSASTTS